MRNTVSSFVLACVIVCLFLPGCGKSDNPVEQRAHDVGKNRRTLKIAAASPWSQERNLLWQGLELARDEINESGGILGRKIELIPFDDDNDIGIGQSKAYEISRIPDIAAVIGHSASSVSVPNALLYHYYGILMMSPLSTSTSLTTQGFDKVFRNIPSDDIFGVEAANFCSKMGWNRVLVYYLDNTYGSSQANVFEQQCAVLDIEVEDRSSYEKSSTKKDYLEMATFWMRNYSFDAIYLAGIMPQAGDIISVLRQQGINEPIIGGDAFDHPLLFKTAGEYAENVHAVTIYDNESTNPAFIEFRQRFVNRYGKEVDQAALQGYDALKVLVEGITRAGSVDPARIAQGLHGIEQWNGPAGPYHFDSKGNVIGKDVIVKRVVGGSFVKVK